MKDQNKHSFKYELKYSLRYPGQGKDAGQFAYAKFLEFYAPSRKQAGTAARLQQMYSKPIMEMIMKMQSERKHDQPKRLDAQSKAIESEDKDDSGFQDEAYMFFESGCENMDQAYVLFQTLMEAGCCKIDGEHPVKNATLDEMDFRDLKKALKEYLGNFLRMEAFS